MFRNRHWMQVWRSETETPPQGGTPILSQEELEHQSQNDSGTQNPDDQQPTSTTNNPPVPAIDADYVKRLESALEQNNRLIQDLMNRSSTPTPPEPPKPEPIDEEKDRELYFADPPRWHREQLDKRLKETIAPIQEFIDGVKSTDTLTTAINEFKEHPNFKPQWDDSVERAVRTQLASVPAGKITKQVIQHAVINAIGLKAVGALGNTPTPPSNPEPRNENVPTPPPNVRPSNPSAPRNTPSNAEPKLDENERRMARENKQTAKEFVFWRDLPPNKLMTAKWDHKTQTGTY